MLHPRNLLRLAQLRGLFIAAQLTALGLARFGLELRLPLRPMLACIVALAVLNVWTWQRARRVSQVSPRQLTLQLAADIAALWLLLALSGGAGNPFVMLLLMPVAVAAAILPARNVWMVYLLALAAHTLLFFLYSPLPDPGLHLGGDHGDVVAHAAGGNTHFIGMWLAMLVSGLLITLFATRLGRELREQDRALAAFREQQLREERVFALANQAAGAAHELGTPLSTIAVLASELEARYAKDDEARADFQLLDAQVNVCKALLSRLRDVADCSADRSADRGEETRSLRAFSAEVLTRFKALRPGVNVASETHGDVDVTLGESVVQLLLILLNNAADASPDSVRLSMESEAGNVQFHVSDQGSGFGHSKEGGLGVGLLLAQATVARLQGSLNYTVNAAGGTTATVCLPLKREGLAT